ncbi:hypothetical protein K523DRAFT_119987 [Schizophyllum commune Tattone D]|nr:hypothetical protein K523DRAFT_119987 [Schizophyllum commune Tattone D]
MAFSLRPIYPPLHTPNPTINQGPVAHASIRGARYPLWQIELLYRVLYIRARQMQSSHVALVVWGLTFLFLILHPGLRSYFSLSSLGRSPRLRIHCTLRYSQCISCPFIRVA